MVKHVRFLCLILSLGFGLSAGEYTWGTVTMGGGGFVSAIITSKAEENLLYARTDVGGAYRWEESTRSWIPITDWVGPNDMGLFGIDALALDPSNPQRIYMLAGTDYWNEGKTMILRSDDYGSSFDTINVTSQFKTHGNGYGRQNGERLAVDPNNPDILFCGTRDDGLWKSSDRGDTWTQVSGLTAPSNGLGICFVLFDKNRVESGVTRRIYAGMSTTDENLYVSDDAGESWTLIPMPELSKQVMPQRAVLTPGGRYLYTTVANGAGPGFGNGVTISRGAVLKYDTREQSWTDISPENWIDDPPHPEYADQTQWDAHLGGFGGISMDHADSNHIVVSSINVWKPQRWDNSARAGWGDKIFATTDGGESWTSVFGDIGDDEIGSVPDDAPIAVLNKNGYNWIEGESIHWAGSIEFDPFDPKRVFVTSGNGIYMADDFSPGERFRWNFTVRGLEETVPMDLVSIPGGPLITVILDYDGFVHDDITQPVSGSRHTPMMGSTTGIDYAKQNPAIVVRVGGNDKDAEDDEYVFPLYYSTDTAKSWTRFVTHPEPGINYKGDIAISSDGEVVLWAPEGRNVMYRTADWGETWTECSGISHQGPYPTADPVNSDVFYAFGGTIYKSTDKGLTFEQVSERNFSWTNDMQVTPGREGHVWVVGYAWDGVNGGFLARSTDGGETFVDINPEDDPRYTQKVQHAEAVGFGKAAPDAEYPAIYIYGTIDGVKGIYQSIDEAVSWVRLDDEMHQYGALANGNFVRGDANTFGVVYRSTAGRGVAVRMPESWAQNETDAVFTRQRIVDGAIKCIGNTLSIDGSKEMLTARVYDLKGRLLFEKAVNEKTVLPLSTIIEAKGIYVTTVQAGASKMLFRKVMCILK
ncbi:MAG: WD40/YVTN/BNR-like repeat-containing protein [Chitinivibrionales bacterium]